MSREVLIYLLLKPWVGEADDDTPLAPPAWAYWQPTAPTFDDLLEHVWVTEVLCEALGDLAWSLERKWKDAVKQNEDEKHNEAAGSIR